ncbi:Uncharacterized protein FWK35_00025160 [Aphis craccivora]|uniref:Uncharacterized protein n=1 Tax=Aphis craccivora TaxID=307492 RepID=A0A6G0YZH9_APHCR|nr:Uncharacterized protein FWK35_00025160 [Aphis craccivora]
MDLVFQNITLRKITNAPPFVSNKTHHKDLENHKISLIKSLHIPSLPGNPRRKMKRKWCRDHLT